MNKPTPGPWVAECVGDSGGENPVEVWEVVSSDGFSRVAEHLSAADARLVAFAPDLLAALRDARALIDLLVIGSGFPGSAYDKARYTAGVYDDISAAIRNATGEQP